MSKLPQIKRLLAEDFKDQQSWIRPLFLILNTFMEAVVDSLNRKITIVENMAGDVRTIQLTSSPSSSAPAILSWTLSAQPKAVLVGNVSGTTTAAVQVSWQTSGTSLQITGLTGCTPTASNPVTITLVIFTG